MPSPKQALNIYSAFACWIYQTALIAVHFFVLLVFVFISIASFCFTWSFYQPYGHVLCARSMLWNNTSAIRPALQCCCARATHIATASKKLQEKLLLFRLVRQTLKGEDKKDGKRRSRRRRRSSDKCWAPGKRAKTSIRATGLQCQLTS